MSKEMNDTNNSKLLIIEAYKRIKEMIFEKKFVPGQKLVCADLSSMLNMSRTPIINALSKLEQDGFVSSRDFRGFYIKSIDMKEVWDAFGVREALEVYAVEQAIKIYDPDEITLCEEKLKEHEEYKPHYYTPKKFVLDSQFHLQIAAAAKNSVLTHLLKNNFEHIYLRAKLDNYDPMRMSVSPQEHHRLLESIKRKDILGSVEIIRNHVQKARDNVIRCLSSEEMEEAASG